MDIKLPRLSWDAQNEIGVTKFDKQHQVLFEYINELQDIMMGAKSDPLVVNKTFGSLFEYTMTHFLDEEVFLYRHSYPAFDDHKGKHDIFIRQVRDLYVRYKGGHSSSRIVAAEIIGMLTEWIQVHIMEEDRKYAAWAINKGVTPE